jgi:hypothetical protein
VVGAVAALQSHAVKVKHSIAPENGQRVCLRADKQTKLPERIASPCTRTSPIKCVARTTHQKPTCASWLMFTFTA